MLFTIVEHKNILKNQSVPFGVIVQGDGEIAYRFDLSLERFNKITDVSPEADYDTFSNFSTSFQEAFINKGVVVTSDDKGGKRVFNVTDRAFLEYLHEKFQNGYQYQKPREVQTVDKEKALSILFDRLVLDKPLSIEEEKIVQQTNLPNP